jgi:hypothetical protein
MMRKRMRKRIRTLGETGAEKSHIPVMKRVGAKM